MRTKIAVLLIVIPLVSVFAQTENVQPQPTEIQTPAQTERPQTAAEETRAVARSRREAPREDALVLFRQGNYTRAAEVCLEELQSPTRTRTQRLDSYVVLCWSLLQADRFRDVIRYGEEGLRLNVNDVRLIFTMCEAYFALKEYQNALEFAQRYVRVAPTGDKLPQVYNYMGQIFLQWKEYYHAVTAFATSVSINPHAGAVWASLGTAKENLKDVKGAREAYRRALSLQSYNETAREGMARLDRAAGAGR